jgi:radical SAM superfamily enzyme YgiQ (UPF0313 family)
VRVVLISTYELGRQPFGLASPAAWLREAGLEVSTVDVSRDVPTDEVIAAADVLAFYLPMHTATRLALPLIARARELNPRARLGAFGLYAPLNEDRLRACGVDAIFAGEFEEELTDWITSRLRPRAAGVPRVPFKVPDRSGLPALARYAALQLPDGSRRVTGYTEASRGCKHLCRHCPSVPVYEGRFRVVPVDVVMADVRAQVAAGARHITFGDPDFFNGIRHAVDVITAFGREFSGVSYDVTIKIEHLLAHADRLPVLARTGCLFVTSAVESVDDRILQRLQKGHTRADVDRAVSLCRSAGLTLAPTFVPFTPWTTVGGYADLLDEIERLDVVTSVPSIQLALRLLITSGSRLLELAEIRDVVGEFDSSSLVYPWTHPDPAVDHLQRTLEAIVARRTGAPRVEVFGHIRDAVDRARGSTRRQMPLPARAAVPYLTEPWYC